MRIGVGYDVHPLVEGRKLVLGGVDIPFEKGLDGHSDADVLVHSIMDALLGAAGLKDIGAHFPSSDMKYKDISSLTLLSHVADLIRDNGWEVVNVDTVVVAERPRLIGYVPGMKSNIAEILGIGADLVGIKGTTTEGLGYEGRGQGIAVHAVVLIEKKQAGSV